MMTANGRGIGFHSPQYDALFSSSDVSAIFGYQGQLTAWLEFEAALARAQARLGIVPDEAAAEITKKAVIETVPVDGYTEVFAATLHPVMPMVRLLTAACDGDLGQYVHWGATTQDVMDTGLVLQIGRLQPLLDEACSEVIRALLAHADQHRGTLTAGRTHAQHAVPITLGYKLAVYADELTRHRARLSAAAADLGVVQFGGAAGTIASLPETGLAVRRELARELGLDEPTITWHTSRDRVAAFGFALAATAMTLQRLAREVMTLQRTEVAELEEPFHDGKIGSSTMPHKRNPVLAETVWALSRTCADALPTVMTGMTQEHERDMAVWALEWDAVPRMADAGLTALRVAVRLVEGLTFFPERMRENVALTRGLIGSETLMMQLATVRGRQRAHELVYAASMRAAAGEGHVTELVRPDLSPEELELLDGVDGETRAVEAAVAMTEEALRRLGEPDRA